MEQILIVEDDSFLNKMLDYNLTADGYGVTSALNARTAAEAIRQREFDLVLLDINLPDGNGFELCKLIKPQHPDTIVIFLTANDQESDQIRGYEVGAVDYITKPFVIGALQRKIKAMFAMLEHHKLYENLVSGILTKEEFLSYKRKYNADIELFQKAIAEWNDKLTDVLENRSERNRWINHFMRFSTMEDIDRRAVMQLIRSIRVMGKDELHIEFNYQDEYQKAISLAEQIATKNEERMVG